MSPCRDRDAQAEIHRETETEVAPVFGERRAHGGRYRLRSEPDLADLGMTRHTAFAVRHSRAVVRPPAQAPRIIGVVASAVHLVSRSHPLSHRNARSLGRYTVICLLGSDVVHSRPVMKAHRSLQGLPEVFLTSAPISYDHFYGYAHYESFEPVHCRKNTGILNIL